MVICVIITIVLSVVPSAAFSDLSGHEKARVIERWRDAGIICGYPDGAFKPDAPATKAHFAKIIANLFILDGAEYKFADVSEDAWYYPYVCKVSEYISFGSVDDISDGDLLFMPDQPIKREAVLKTVSLLAKTTTETIDSLTDTITRAELIQIIDTALGGEVGFLYTTSVKDAHIAEEDEIMPLVTLTEDSDLATWNDKGQVLLLSWHSSPELYIPDTQFNCEYGEIWTFTDKEALLWYGRNGQGITDWELRFRQLLGLPTSDVLTHVSAFWVYPDDIIRPAYQTDITRQITPALLDGSSLGEHKEWFDNNTEFSFVTSAYPWTKLGYTYDWMSDQNEYGMTEFLILPDSVIDVEWTKDFREFINWLEESQGMTTSQEK